jgi:MFS family permease
MKRINVDVSSKKAALGKVEYKWIVLSVTTIGALMAAIDSTIVILALPYMMEELHADLVTMVWVIMAYILISTVFLLTFGRVADMLGRVRMYNLGFAIFTIGSALCGVSGTATELILFRLVQGSGAALMVVNSVAILTEAWPGAGGADPQYWELALDFLRQRTDWHNRNGMGFLGLERALHT